MNKEGFLGLGSSTTDPNRFPRDGAFIGAWSHNPCISIEPTMVTLEKLSYIMRHKKQLGLVTPRDPVFQVLSLQEMNMPTLLNKAPVAEIDLSC